MCHWSAENILSLRRTDCTDMWSWDVLGKPICDCLAFGGVWLDCWGSSLLDLEMEVTTEDMEAMISLLLILEIFTAYVIVLAIAKVINKKVTFELAVVTGAVV